MILNSSAVELRRSQRIKFLSDKAREEQATHRGKHSAGFVKNSKIHAKANPSSGDPSSSTPKQIWRAVRKNEPCEDSNNQSSRTYPSAEIQQEPHAQKNKYSKEAANKGSNRNQDVDRRKNLSPRNPEQFIRFKEKTGNSEDSSGQVHLDQPSPTNKNSREVAEKREALSLPGKRQPFNVKNKKFSQVQEHTGTSNQTPSKMMPSPRIMTRKPARKNKDNAETVKHIIDQLQAVRNSEAKSSSLICQVKGRAEASKYLSSSSGERPSNRYLQDKPILNQKWRCRRSLSRQQRNREAFLHHIKWDASITVGESCSLCEKDLVHFPAPSKLELDAEFDKLPDVAVLPCCHAFHMQCLEMLLGEEQFNDPPCLTCAFIATLHSNLQLRQNIPYFKRIYC